MTVVPVNASKNYNVLIGNGLLKDAAAHILQILTPSKVVIVTDSNVSPLYAEQVSESFQKASVPALQYVIPAGESSKSMDTFSAILNFLAQEQISRSDALVALGGGVVGDVTGFAAACYMRGISYVQIPTTLLAMVDSSVGGKTAIDLPAGKNLAGAFWQPSLVLCDTDTLRTLPSEIFLDGCAEILKYGILFDAALFNSLTKTGADFDYESAIALCVKHKRDVIEKDEFDHGKRQLLNLGHTVGHAIEQLSSMQITHGNAVAMGIAIVTRSATAAGICTAETKNSIIATIRKFGFPTETELSAKDIAITMCSDKKRIANAVNLILPQKIGCCAVVPTAITELETFLKAGM